MRSISRKWSSRNGFVLFVTTGVRLAQHKMNRSLVFVLIGWLFLNLNDCAWERRVAAGPPLQVPAGLLRIELMFYLYKELASIFGDAKLAPNPNSCIDVGATHSIFTTFYFDVNYFIIFVYKLSLLLGFIGIVIEMLHLICILIWTVDETF